MMGKAWQLSWLLIQYLPEETDYLGSFSSAGESLTDSSALWWSFKLLMRLIK